MAKEPAGNKPAPRKTPPKKPAVPAKETAGKSTPARKRSAAATDKPDPVPRKPRSTIKKESEQDTLQLGLSAKQQKFVDEYLVDLNGAQAAIRAGYSPDTARFIGHENLTKPYIQLAIAEARKAQQERTQITADAVVRELAMIAFADARELAEVKTGCCRCCYGEGHKYQRTLLEMNSDRERWLDKGKDPSEFDEQGGIGFNPLLLPNSDCPNCGGDGQARTVLKDTRHLSPRAVALYAGAKQTKEGIEIKMHSKLDALEKLAKHVGLYEKDNTQKVDPLAALLHRISGNNGNGFSPVDDDPERKPSSMPVRQDDLGDED